LPGLNEEDRVLKEFSRRKCKLVTTSKEYASAATPHGFAYIGKDGRPVLERMFWAIIILLAMSFTVLQMMRVYKEWQDDPVITTLNNVAQPIENIEFPSITICPQGSVNEILSSVMFKQLKEYILKKERGVRSKRASKENGEQKHQFKLNLSLPDMLNETREFLKEVYPGAKGNPMNLIRLMTSRYPLRTLSTDSILAPTDADDCDPSSNSKILETLNSNVNKSTCPNGFEMLVDNICIHSNENPMTYDEASVYCKQQQGANVLYLESSEMIKALESYLIPGTYISL